MRKFKAHYIENDVEVIVEVQGANPEAAEELLKISYPGKTFIYFYPVK
jgi:hypothetical protein